MQRTRPVSCSTLIFQSQASNTQVSEESAVDKNAESKASGLDPSADQVLSSTSTSGAGDIQNAQDQVSTPEVPTPVKSVQAELEDNFSPYRFVYPEFLPDPKLIWRNRIREKLERIDMLKRRANIEIPEFYVGTLIIQSHK